MRSFLVSGPKETSDDVRAVFFIALAYLDIFVQSGSCEHLVNMGTTPLMNRLYLLFLAPQLIQVSVEILAERSNNIFFLMIMPDILHLFSYLLTYSSARVVNVLETK